MMTKFLCSAAALALLSAPACAEEAEIVVTATGFEQDRAETGQAITVIDRDALETRQALSIADILATIPGVSIAGRGGVGGQTSAFIRGGNSAQTLVLIDGVRLNDPSSPNGAFDFGGLLTGNADRVEVLRGPNSIIWGSQAIGGVINIRSIAPTQALSISASGEYGSHDTAQVRANLSGTSGRFEGSVGGSLFTTKGISSLSAGTEEDGYRNAAANGRLKINLADGLSLDFRSYYNKGRVQYDSPFGAGGNALPVSRNTQFIGYVGANFSGFDDKLSTRLSFARTDIKRIGEDPVVFSFNNFDVRGKVDRFELHNSFAVANAITLIFGAEHERTRTSTSFEGFAADLADEKVTGGFVQAIVKPLTGLTLTGGVRHDDYSTYGGHTTLGGNIAYSPNDGNTVVRATFGEGFRAPTLSEGQPPYGNTNLKPETARNVDIGIEQHFLDHKARASITWFNRKSDNLIVYSFSSFQSENIEKVKTDGLEVELALKPVPSLSLSGSLALVNARIRSTGAQFGNRLPLRPSTSASLSIDWKTPWSVSLGSTLRIVGDSFDNQANTVRLDGYALADIRAAVPVMKGVELYGRIENLFDARYTRVANYGTYGRTGHVGVRAAF